MRRLLLAVVLVAPAGALAGQAPAPPASLPVIDSERERFLLEAEVVRRHAAPQGVTLSERATLSLDGVEHDAHVQDVDEAKIRAQMAIGYELDFRDSWRGNVAAYRLDRLLGLEMVPVTVERRDGRRPASFTWWVDDFLMDEKTRLKKKAKSPDVPAWNRQMYAVRIFDQLIYNFDRNAGNLVIDTHWRIWMIDHTCAFKRFKEIKDPRNLGDNCPRALLEGLRRLDKAGLEKEMDDLLDVYQIEGLLGRRDQIVRHFEGKIARRGENVVLYELPARGATAAPR